MHQTFSQVFHSCFLSPLKVLDLIPIDCTKVEDIMELKSHILSCIQSESVFLCSESILPKSYESVEQVIHKLVTRHDIPQHGEPVSDQEDHRL